MTSTLAKQALLPDEEKIEKTKKRKRKRFDRTFRDARYELVTDFQLF